MNVALVHDWLTGMRGGEKVLEVLCELYPEADIFTLLHERGSVSPRIERHRIITSPLQRVPDAASNLSGEGRGVKPPAAAAARFRLAIQ